MADLLQVHSAQAGSSPRDGKYTHGLEFGHGNYARAVVERSCVALLTLLQDVFAVAEKTAFQEAVKQDSVQGQNRAFKRLADMICYRPLLEKSLVTAVTCAYADIGNTDNAVYIEKRISALEKMRCERLDLVSLFGVDAIRDQVTNRTRPLLFDLSAQIGLLFPPSYKKDFCNPLSPATLIGGFVAGLMCAEMDILAKQLLFRTFEQEFLARLSVLLNSVILRLDQENTFEKRVVAFNDKDAGPIARVLHHPSVLTLAELQQAIDTMHQSLTACKSLPVAQGLCELSAEDSVESVMTLLSDVSYHYPLMQAAERRRSCHVRETQVLVEARKKIAEQLNSVFQGKSMPLAVKSFLETLWPDVLFALLMASGESSEIWQEAMLLQQALLESVTPVQDAGQLATINRTVPNLVRTLRKLLVETGCRFEDVTAFLGTLKLLHLQNVQQKLDAGTFVLWQGFSMGDVSPSTVSIFNQDEIICYAQMQQIISLLVDSRKSANSSV